MNAHILSFHDKYIKEIGIDPLRSRELWRWYYP